MSTPVVVQGTAVSQPTAPPGSSGYGNPLEVQPGYGAASNNNDRSDKVETSCNDPIFAILFYAALVAICAVAALYGPDVLEGENTTEENTTEDFTGYIYVTAIIVFISFIAAGLGMMILMSIPQFLIKAALIFTVLLSGLMCAASFVTGNIVGGVISLIFFALTCCYAYFVWSRIPFATANLVTGCTAIKANLGVAVYAYLFAILGGGWAIIWSISFAGVYDTTYGCNDAGQECSPNWGYIFLLFLSFYFVQQVLQNCIHVQVAGTVASWWYDPSESGCCSSAVNSSFIRTMTTSFGSICFGSFLVALIQTLKQMANQARDQGGEMQILLCIAECLLGCLASIVEYFNKWAFIYVGVYGMSYLKAGKSVFELFQNRGWEAIIADDLVGMALFLVSLVMGLLTGAVAVVVEVAGDFFDEAGSDAKLVAFFVGLLVGFLVTSIFMSTIASSVNAVIVLFAEGPNEFQQNHPELSNTMREVWNRVYPGSV